MMKCLIIANKISQWQNNLPLAYLLTDYHLLDNCLYITATTSAYSFAIQKMVLTYPSVH